MHDAVMRYVADQLATFDLAAVKSVLDLGGRDVNGTTRCLFDPDTRYVAVDIRPHPSVDVVADAADVNLGDSFDVVVSTELLEHTDKGEAIVANAYRHLKDGGTFLATMAGPGRPAHGAGGESTPPPDEWYRNVEPDELATWIERAGFSTWSIDVAGDDVRCWARK